MQQAAPEGVTIVVQTRAEPGRADEFAAWQQRIARTVAAQPGFISQNVIPPEPPAQVDWVIQQRFASKDTALAWLRSDERQRLLAEAEPMIMGQDDVHLVADNRAGFSPAPVSAVISTKVKPGQEQTFREWARKIAAVETKYPGFQGYRLEAPVPGVQDDWLTIIRFDSEANLQNWFDSPAHKQFLEEAKAFTEEWHSRIARTGFDQWFTDAGAAPPPAWKQNMVVLMVLYPLVFLLNAWLQKPILVGIFHLPYWLFLFVNNAASVILLSLVLPPVSRQLAWWLSPAERDRKRDLAGVALVIFVYALLLVAFWQYQTWFGLPF
jgi:antibiotic biosynthesis monooxygenase (ABM) superfamily enzyme